METARQRARSAGLHEAVASIAAKHPSRTALVVRGRSTTYAELDTAADAMAARLSELGTGPGKLVPVVLPRGRELVVVLLAVLKTGAAYALLDGSWPAREMASVLGDLGADIVVTTPGQELPAGTVRIGASVPLPPVPFTPVAARPDQPCCVFFTSGTTGRPKGVVVPHRATNRLFLGDSFADFGPDTVIMLAAAPPWDAFSLELWGGLFNGGTCVVVEEPFLSPDSLRSGIKNEGVNTVWVTSSLFNMLVDEALESFDGLSQVLIGGERLSPPHVRRFLERHHPAITLLNGYGPVESTVFASTHRIEPADYLRPGGIPLGICVPGTTVFVMDGDRECRRDEEGEICVAGDGLAIEYLGDPDLTASKFVTVELRGRAQRIYRTGDLGVWASPDGLLAFRGRADRQVKVRGNRVEPADIEVTIQDASPRVAACRVVPRRAGDGTVELVAFCIPRHAGDPLTDLAADLGNHLASHKVPAQVVSVATFPLTARGKIDTAQLLAAAVREPALALASPPALEPDGMIATSDGLSDQVDAVDRAFAFVLGTATVPHNVSFFALGGSSLGAGRVCARLGTQTGRSIPVSQIYRTPTVAGLAQWLRHSALPDDPTYDGPTDSVALTPQQLVFLTRDYVDPEGLTNHCLLTWRISGQVNLSALDHALVSAHARQASLRSSYTFEPTPAAVLSDIEAPPLQVLPPAADEESALAVMREALSEPFDAEAADVWRAVIVPIGAGESSYFGCVVHHIAFDGRSESVLADELSRAYNVEPYAGPAPTPHQLAEHRRCRRFQADVSGQVARLADQLAGARMPAWPGGGPAQPGVRTVTARLSAIDVHRVDALARRHDTTRFTCLLSAWGLTLAVATGVDDVTVGVPVSSRVDADEDGYIGCCINTVPVRLAGLRDQASTSAPVAETEASTVRAMSCQDAPLSDLVDELRRRSSHPVEIFNTIFALQDNPAPMLRLNGLSAEHVRQPYLALPTDLHLELWPLDDGGLTAQLSSVPGLVPDELADRLLSGFLSATVSGAVPKQGAR